MRLLRSLALLVAATCVAFTAAGAALAQAPSACPPTLNAEDLRAAMKQPPRDRGLLWRVQKDGRTSWLYGTLHVLRPDWALPGPQVRAAVLASDAVALEVDFGDPDVARAFAQPADPQRRDRVLAGLQERMERAAARACVDGPQLAAIEPMFQLMTVTLAEARRDGLYPEIAADAVVWELARRSGKRVVGLETAQMQIKALQPEREDDERMLIDRGLQEMESGESASVLQRLAQAWAAGDEAQLAHYDQWCHCEDTPAEARFSHRVIDQRNDAMADRLAALHHEGSFFAAVGVLHLAGPHSVVELLRARGFTVQRIAFDPQP
jgi:uncharacterized protein YbaP (TraB family)